jgi:hypothetical protein
MTGIPEAGELGAMLSTLTGAGSGKMGESAYWPPHSSGLANTGTPEPLY